VSEELIERITTAVDRLIGWAKLPRALGLLELVGIRDVLRHRNLHHPPGVEEPATSAPDARHLVVRTVDGSFNDLSEPWMGRARTVFGRNVPIERTFPEDESGQLSPNPRTVSRRLLTRDPFEPATTLNVLAACWLQFEIRDWFRHGDPPKENPWTVPLADDDPWPEHPMRIERTAKGPPAPPGEPPLFINTETHWWDASQLYGSTPEFQKGLRSGVDGKLKLTPEGALPFDPTALGELPGGVEGWWLGLAMMHTIWMREHNAVCDRLKAEYPSWSDDDLFDHARLVVAALIAKIHTVEWTTGILGHPTLQIAMRANWWGIATERVHRLLGRLSSNEVISGIPGSPTNHNGVPYAMTEEFVAVYRMHPLIPDDYEFRSVADDHVIRACEFADIAGRSTTPFMGEVSMTDALYSFGTAHPGAIQLHNYPRALQRLERLDGSLIDLAAIDVLRIRERGVPRYNDFRRLLHLEPAATFEEITANPEWAQELREVYGDVDRVDLMVGMYAEQPPPGFGFSDTAFRIFVLMASRRLKSDRFFTADYTPEVYTQAGLDWIEANDMRSVLLRHFPGLAPALRGVKNAFAPWARVGPPPGGGAS